MVLLQKLLSFAGASPLYGEKIAVPLQNTAVNEIETTLQVFVDPERLSIYM